MTRYLSVRSGPLTMEIAPELSGRVARLSFRGNNLLSGTEAHSSNWGATYWTSPQSDWGWPPVPEVDGLPYELVESPVGEASALILRSRVADLGKRRFMIEKRFEPGPRPGCIDTSYTIVNVGGEPFKMANWEISRVPPGGLTFFPTGEVELNAVKPHQFLPVEKEAGTTFYDHSLFESGHCLKMHADGRGGYLAHLAGDLLMVKIFQESSAVDQAPGEGECEIFANDDGQYVEVEVQGPYALIVPEGRSTFGVRSHVCSLPEGIHRSDRQGLRAFCDGVVASFR